MINTWNNVSLLDYYSRYYINFHQYIHSLKKNCYLIDFDRLIKEPASVFVNLNHKLQSAMQLKDDFIISEINRVKDRDFGAKDSLGSSKPNETKNKLKKELATLLVKKSHSRRQK